MLKRDIIVIGASAGGVEALAKLVKHFPTSLPAVILIAVHFPSTSTSYLPRILSRAGKLAAVPAEDGAPILPGHIYIAPPDYHLLVQSDRIHLSRGPRENGHRPAIDTLFRTAARCCGPRVIGIILSGALDDGTAGLAIIKAHRGLAMVQDPAEATFDGMVRNAIARVDVDYILPLEAIAQTLITLVDTPVDEEPPMSEEITNEEQLVAQDKGEREQGQHPNTPSPLTCPDCGGTLWELHDGDLIRFRCHVGHAYSLDSLVSEQSDDVERALWSSIRALEEKAALARRMAVHAQQQSRPASASQFSARAEEAEHHAALVRQMVLQQHTFRPIPQEPTDDTNS